MIATRIAAALLVFCAAGTASSQACAACGGEGVVPCRTCAPVEAGAVACTVAANCARCKGALAVPCPECSAGTDEVRRRRELAQRWLAERRALCKDSGVEERTVLQCRTAHFDLLFAPGPIGGCPEKDAHLQMHLFAARLDWRVTKTNAKLGALDDGPLEDPERELAAWGTSRVFRFPAMPPGLIPGRGRA